MTDEELLIVAPFPSELPRSDRFREQVCGSRAAWQDDPGPLPGTGPVLVTGTCGALLPGHGPGALVLPSRVRRLDGTWLEPDPELLGRVLLAARRSGQVPNRAPLAEVAAVVDGEPQRAAIAGETGCRFVDMESASLAAAAQAAQRPWVVLRFVSDGPERPLAWLSELFGGFPVREPRCMQTLAALARRPRHLLRLAALGRGVARGRGTVRRVLEELEG